ncbi:endonuclease/exonuclease/phosphatase family protein [Microbacterium esteraromaticum]|uniref:endonuclease/exonuclease/phosphatase family protein n=1 Tax=Microbacterium esteraromaticum TaxID=57043 RepID=UPI00195BCDB1|nr:endonuclease/exonuclease/phosphatase family protein [Microbacterium esteraromaticum]MBM7467057.1 endonuclease/exonuclease/phosphatase (EEP) superfamily protein YafD [Microbacterium esteraromaticum]
MLRLVGILFTVLFAIATAILIWPQFFQLEMTYPIAQVVASRAAALVALLVVAVLAALLLFARPLRGLAASILIVSLVGAGSIGLIGALRGYGADALPEKTDDAVRVLSWNTAGAAVSAETIAGVIDEQRADIVALPETSEEVGEKIAIMMRESGRPMWVHHVNIRPDVPNGPQAWQTTILISAELGEYSVIDSSRDGSSNTGSVPSAVAMPVDGTGPTIVAVHAVAPREDAMAQWRSDLEWIADQCPEGEFILAGDFNATLDHMSSFGIDGGTMGRCVDAASRTGNGMVGTWPATLPRLAGAPIDHIMSSPQWKATGTLVLADAGGSDHRALVAQLEPAGAER